MTTAAAATSSSNTIMQSYLTQQAANVAADKTSSTTTSSSSSSSSTSSATSIGTNFNTFIKILTTQLQNQDPTNATDPNQFTQELVQFAGVEQQLKTNSDLDTLVKLQKASGGATTALGYMGQYVEATTTTGDIALQSGSTEFGYTLPSAASSANITIKDSSGKTVDTISGDTSKGTHYLSWDGKNSSGTQLADGTYTFSVTAKDFSGSAITLTDMRVIGKVTGVASNSDGTFNLSLDDVSASTSDIDGVYSAGNLPSSTAA